jgi:hypothetical protein
MNKLNHSLPLAFLLALAADGANAPVVEAKESAPVLTYGMLSDLLADGNSSSNVERPPLRPGGQKVAQFFRNFGFPNCFSGNWRNC